MSDNKTQNQARKICELFRGRFSQEVAERLVTEFGGEIQAVDFVMNEPEAEVTRFLRETPEYLDQLRRDSESTQSLLKNGISTSVRQFACRDCNRSWWRRVPRRKEVSKCSRCNVKYDPIERDEEWAMCRFDCDCGNSFISPGIFGVTKCRCYHCGSDSVEVVEVLPPRAERPPKTRSTPHSCNGVNCYSRPTSPGHDPHLQFQLRPRQWRSDSIGRFSGPREADPVCIHPRSSRCPPNRVLHASKKHVSTGSTVATFLSQGSLDIHTVDLNYNLERISEDD